MSVKLRLGVAQDLVVDPEGIGALEDRIAYADHVFEELGSSLTRQVVQAGDNRIAKQQTIAWQELHIADDGPSRG
jgi:hypothetical protein